MRTFVAIAITLAAVATNAARPAAADDDRPARPYTTPLTPTGELLHRGEFQRSWDVAMQGDVALGLSDRVELRFQGHVVMTGDLQLRVALLPRSSPAQIVVGGDVAGTLLDGAKSWLGGSLAVAYRGDGWQLHATTRILENRGASVDLAQTTAGLMGTYGHGNLLFVDVGQVAWRSDAGCTVAARTTTPEPPGCATVDSAYGVAFGTWWTSGGMSWGLSAIVVRTRNTVIPILPLLSMSWSD